MCIKHSASRAASSILCRARCSLARSRACRLVTIAVPAAVSTVVGGQCIYHLIQLPCMILAKLCSVKPSVVGKTVLWELYVRFLTAFALPTCERRIELISCCVCRFHSSKRERSTAIAFCRFSVENARPEHNDHPCWKMCQSDAVPLC